MPSAEKISNLKIHKLTQEQYDRELTNGNIDPNAFYITPQENSIDEEQIRNIIEQYLIVQEDEPDPLKYPEGALWIKPIAL